MTFWRLVKSITKNEWQFIFTLSAVLVIVTNLPLIYGWLIRPAGSVFTGVHLAMLTDWFVYYSYLEQVRQGHWLFFDLFTFEPHLPFINPFWLLVGLLAKWFNLSNLLAFNFFRSFLILPFVFIAYLFSVLVFENKFLRKFSLIILTTSSGLGFLLIGRIIKFPGNFENGILNWPMDLWVPEFNTFATLYYSPHLIASLILIISIFLLTILFSKNLKNIYGLVSGLLSLALILFHPFHAITVFGVVFLYLAFLIFRQKKIIWSYLIYLALLGLMSLPAIIYYSWLIKNDYVTRIKYAQNICLSTPFWLTIFALGLLLLPALYGIWIIFKNKTKDDARSLVKIFLAIWFLSQLSFLYLPVLFQRRISEGLHFPLVFLAILGCAYFKEKHDLQNFRYLLPPKEIVLVLTVVFLSLSNIFLISADLYTYKSQKEFVYLDKSIVQAMGFLKNIPQGKVVLNTARKIVNVIPAYSGKTVYTGHGVETISFFGKQQEVDWFFELNRKEEVELDFLKKRNIGYIFYTKQEELLGDFNPSNKNYLDLIYQNEKVKIFEVN